MAKKNFLDFEQPIAEMEGKIEELRYVQTESAVDISEEIASGFCAHLDLPRARFDEVIERYRNPKIWKRGANGRWEIPGHLEG